MASSEDAEGRLKAALADRYRIERKIGSGGMATVFLAQDLKHDRKVAIKVLKPELAAVLGADRFLSEIKVTANLQHPHILPLHDSGEADGFLFYVMPFVEGESLRAKLDREKQLSVDEAVGIARSVASALDYAHRHGVIHRDIKPANILLHDGQPMVADFGIALAVRAAGGERLTETGLSLGTPQYMSPEQAAGDREVDGRSDLYSLGCVLYEMLTGEPPHSGPTVQAVIAKLLMDKPRPVTELRETVPAHVAAVVHKALAKLPADRLARAGEMADSLSDERFAYGAMGSDVGFSSEPWPRRKAERFSRGLPYPLAALVVVLLAGFAAWGWLRRTTDAVTPVPTRARILLERNSLEGGGVRLAISPDGRLIVARGAGPDADLLYLRRAEDAEWMPLPDTREAANPEFSPNGEWVLFAADGGLYKIRTSGGPRVRVAESSDLAHWAFNDTIYFTDDGALFRVSPSGESPEELLRDDGVWATRPFLLPDGKGVLLGTRPLGDPINSRIVLFDLETRAIRELVPSGTNPQFIPSGRGSEGYIVFGHGNQTLMGVTFDLESREVRGEPVPLISPVTVRPGGAVQYDVSESGTLIYNGSALETVSSRRHLVRVGLDGTAMPYPLSPGSFTDPRFSPDGASIAYLEGLELRVFDVATGANSLLASGGGQYPVWPRGSDFLYFSSSRDELPGEDGFRIRPGATGEPEQLAARDGRQIIQDVLPGDTLLLIQEVTARGGDLLLLRLTSGGPELEPFLTADWEESRAQISPDGQWVAYVSTEGGGAQVFIRTFPDPSGGPYPVSPEGGVDPIWAPDGETLYFRRDSTFFAAEVGSNPALFPAPPRELFLRPHFPFTGAVQVRNWDIHPDGSHFVIVESVTIEEVEGSPESAPDSVGISMGHLYIVTNWFQELKERMGGWPEL